MVRRLRRFGPRRPAQKVGQAPGSLVYTGETRAERPRLTWMQYDSQNLQEGEAGNVAELTQIRQPGKVAWLNVQGLHDTSLIEEIGTAFEIHPLTQEDILNTGQRPKLEEFDHYVFLTLRMLQFSDNLEDEQISLVFGKDFVISFLERSGEIFDPVKERIRQKRPRLRSRGADYLAYALADSVVDHYFVIIEKVGNELEQLGEEVIREPGEDLVERIYGMRARMAMIRRAVWPLRELLSRFERLESQLVDDGTRVFLRDVYDHTVQLIDVVETFREMTSSMIDLHLSVASNRMNEVMKVLTVMASIFIPLTFLAGIYGMNFEYMPELHVPGAYFGLLMLMILIAAVMVIYFRKKKWL